MDQSIAFQDSLKGFIEILFYCCLARVRVPTVYFILLNSMGCYVGTLGPSIYKMGTWTQGQLASGLHRGVCVASAVPSWACRAHSTSQDQQEPPGIPNPKPHIPPPDD